MRASKGPRRLALCQKPRCASSMGHWANSMRWRGCHLCTRRGRMWPVPAPVAPLYVYVSTLVHTATARTAWSVAPAARCISLNVPSVDSIIARASDAVAPCRWQHQKDNAASELIPWRGHQCPGPRIPSSQQVRGVQAKQSEPGHDAPHNRNSGRHIPIHGFLPHCQLKVVKPLDLQAAEFVDCLSRLGSQGLRDDMENGSPVGIAQFHGNPVVGEAAPGPVSPASFGYPGGAAPGRVREHNALHLGRRADVPARRLDRRHPPR